MNAVTPLTSLKTATAPPAAPAADTGEALERAPVLVLLRNSLSARNGIEARLKFVGKRNRFSMHEN
jgi:hypothetical protein